MQYYLKNFNDLIFHLQRLKHGSGAILTHFKTISKTSIMWLFVEGFEKCVSHQ